MVNVEWSDRALVRLQEIYGYLCDKASMRIAGKVKKKLLARTRILVDNPRAGQCEGLLDNSDKEYRYLVEGNYKIIYRVAPDKVVVSTIFDCRQNPVRMSKEL